ncbi:MAG: oligosaccharide flippase family protein [Bacteroidaceae bacterium]|nr:oligosaccharide flippase family protein [Bacteroidaceae bacterium]MBQ4163273.1 oligosaccharide flippase family protein [Parabacteroides sp.]
MSEKTKLLKNTTIYAIGDIVPRALSFITFPILTSYLTPADYGIVNYVNTIINFLFLLGFLCLNTYYLVYYYKANNEEERRNLLGNLSIFVISINLILSILICIFGYIYPNIFSKNIDFYPYIIVGIITNFFNLFSVLPSALYRVKENPLPLTILNLVKGILAATINIVLVVFFHFTALGLLYSAMCISIIFGLIFIYITLRNMNWYFNWQKIKIALRFSLPLLPGVIAYYLLAMSDRFFIERYLGLERLGVYSTAMTLSLILNIISNGAYKAFEPYFFKIYGSLNFKKKFYRVRDYFLFAILISALGISLYAKEFFIFFATENYKDVFFYVPLTLFPLILSSVSLLYSTIVTAKGKTHINSLATMIGGFASVIQNLVLIPYLGLIGACASSFFAFLVILSISIYYSNLHNKLLQVVIPIALVAIVILFSVYMLKWSECIYINIIIKSLIYLFTSIGLYKYLNLDFLRKRI